MSGDTIREALARAAMSEQDQRLVADLAALLVELARWSYVATLDGDLHARIASALALYEEFVAAREALAGVVPAQPAEEQR